MKTTTQYAHIEIVTGKDHATIMVRSLVERELMNGKMKATTILKSNIKKRSSYIRLNTFISKEYILTQQQFQSFAEMKDLFQIDVSNLKDLSA